MALIKCPECGKEVSDTANSCPNCGFNIKKHIEDEKKKQELEKKIQAKNEKSQMSSKTKNIIIGISIVLVAIIAFLIVQQKQKDEQALTNLKLLFYHVEDINEYKEYSVMQLDDGTYIYHDTGADNAVSKISQRLKNLDICVEYIDGHYSESSKAIDDMIGNQTNYGWRSWEDYRKILESNYFIDDNITERERAEKIIDRYVDIMVD